MAEIGWKYTIHGADEMSEWTNQSLHILLSAFGTNILRSPLFSLLKVVNSDLVQSLQDVITNSFPRWIVHNGIVKHKYITPIVGQGNRRPFYCGPTVTIVLRLPELHEILPSCFSGFFLDWKQELVGPSIRHRRYNDAAPSRDNNMVLTVCVVRHQLNATVNQTKHSSQLTNLSIKNYSA